MKPLPLTLTELLGAEVTDTRPMHGGDISEVHHVTLSDGREMVVKRGPLVDAEARMLAAMALVEAPVPQLLHAEKGLICIEYLVETEPKGDSWRRLGEELAKLHSLGNPTYGWHEDYAFRQIGVENAPLENWVEFYAERRLAPALPHLPTDMAKRVEALIARLGDLLPAEPTASFLHGDLWTGNLLFTDEKAYMIDPACYHGHAEVDLAMLSLLGTPDPALWEGYGTPEDGHEERKPVYQMFPALTHYRLFGESYTPMVNERLDAIGV